MIIQYFKYPKLGQIPDPYSSALMGPVEICIIQVRMGSKHVCRAVICKMAFLFKKREIPNYRHIFGKTKINVRENWKRHFCLL